MMNVKDYRERGIFMAVVIMLVLACSLPSGQTSVSPNTKVSTVITETQPKTTTSSKTTAPTLPNMKSGGNSGGGQTLTATKSPTPTLTMPDFDSVINFAGGGGGLQAGCEKYSSKPNSISVSTSFGDSATLCAYLQNANAAAPIKINLTQLGGAGMVLSSNDLILNRYGKSVYWEGFPIGGQIDVWADDDSIQFAIPVWWPVTLPPGNWRFKVYQEGGMQVSTDFQVSKQNGQSYINAIDVHSAQELTPIARGFTLIQYLQPADNGKLNFAGNNYPSNTLVYVLLYHFKGELQYELIEKKVVLSDSSGSITGELSGPFGAGQSYILYGITDPNAVLGRTNAVTCAQALGSAIGLSCDYFEILPAANSVPSKIDAKYTALGGTRSMLGRPAGLEQETTNEKGRFRDFQFGSIYWTSGTGTFEVHGLIRGKWESLGSYGGFLGYPTTDELTTPDGIGRYNHFQGGSIYWTPDTGAHEIQGSIREKWGQLGWERSILGYPTTDELTTPDGIGRYNHFQGGSIYWTPDTGAYEVHGSIRDKWAEMGWENSCLGYPISDEEFSSGGWERQS